MPRDLAPLLLNAIGFQAVWLACVAGAGLGLLWPGLLSATLFAALVLRYGGRRASDLRALLLLLPLGIAVDSVFAASGWLVYDLPLPSTQMAPAWIVALWVGFILTLNHSLSFLANRPWQAGLFGLAGGPLAYSASEQVFGAVEYGVPDMQALVAIGLAWSLFLPLAFALLRRLPGMSSSARPA